MLRRMAGDSIFYVLAMLLTRGISFLVIPLYTHNLNPEEYGIVGFASTVTTVLAMLITLGLDAALVRFYGDMDTKAYRSFVSTLWIWLTLFPLAFVATMEWWGPLVLRPPVVNVPWNPYLRLAAWNAYLSVAPLVPLSLLRAEGKAQWYGALSVGSFLTTTGFLIYFVAVRKAGALGNLQGQLLAGIVIAVVSHGLVLPWLTALRDTGFVWAHFRTACRLCIPYLPHAMCMWALNFADRWILQKTSLAELGTYSLAYTLGMLVHLFGLGVMSAYAPVYFQRAGDVGFRTSLPRLLSVSIGLYTWVAVSVSVLAPEMLALLAPRAWGATAHLVPWIAAGYWCFVAIYQFCLTVLEHHKRTEWTILLTGAPAVANIALNWVLVPRLGALAAAINTLVAFGLMALLSLLVSRRLDPVPFPWLKVAAVVTLGVLTGAAGLTWLTLPQAIPALLLKAALLVGMGIAFVRVIGFTLSELVAFVTAILANRKVPADP